MIVAVREGEVWSDDSGEPRGGSELPLLLLHPGVGDSSIWDLVRPQWTPTYRVIRYDVRGYGQSPAAAAEFSPLEDAVAVLDHYGLERAHVVGSSMGGNTALGLALTHPERVATLVLVCPGISGYEWPDEPELEAEFERAQGDPEAKVQFGLKVWAAAGVDGTVDRLMRSAARGWASDAQFEREDPPVWGRLGEVDVPTVLMVGDLDRAVLVESNLKAAQLIPGCRLLELPGVDHLPPIRVPDLVTRTVLEHCRT